MFKRLVSILSLIVSDVTAIYVAVILSSLVRNYLSDTLLLAPYEHKWDQFISLGLIYIVLFSIYFFGLYLKRFDFWEELKRIIKALFLSFTMFLFYLFAIKTAHEYSRSMFVLLFLNLLWLIPLFRIVVKKILFKLNIWQLNIWLYGDDQQLYRLKKTIKPNWFLGYNIVKNLQDADVVAIATKGMPTKLLEEKINQYKSDRKDILLIPYLNKISFSNTELIELIIGRISLINIQNQLFKQSNLFIKKLAEIFVILIILPIGLFVLIIVSSLIKLDSRGTIFFKQKRLGKDGKIFSCYKFRTMREDSKDDLEKYLKDNPDEIEYFKTYHKYHIDPRFTRVGKFIRKLSLDELPQIFNVIRGDMSLIGPRPYMIEESNKLEGQKEIILHVKPGITGLWQVSGRNELTFNERIELDVWYIQNWSLWLDFVIFLKTFQVLLSRRGAS